ncbi:MAG: serine protease [Planctomycetota bacterium]
MFARPAIVCLAALLTAAPSVADSGVFQQLLDSSVWIVNLDTDTTGSGVVVDAERRLVITNYHVVGESREVALFFAAYDSEGRLVTDGGTYAKNFKTLEEGELACFGKVVGTWKERDLALVELDFMPSDVTGVPLSETGATPGEAVHSVGNPSASDALWVYSPGSVRQVYRRNAEFSDGQKLNARMVEVTSPINGGDSGSGMVNSRGELIGIVSWMSHAGRLMSYAIDISEVKALLQSYGMEAPAGTVVASNQMATVNWPQ